MSTPDNMCANCGKGEECSGDLKSCTACKMVKYCNRDCQIAHRPHHKKECKKRAADLYDEKLFKEPPLREDCPICMLLLPLYDNHTGICFHSCCGKDICNGCVYAMSETGGKNMKLCPFCKAPKTRSPEAAVERAKKLMEKGNNAHAFYQLGGYYEDGTMGFPQNEAKANELYRKAGELGCAQGYYNLGVAYRFGNLGEVDKKKAKYFYELAAMNGHIKARHNLGCMEGKAGNYQRAYKHFIISASAGYKRSLDEVKKGYMHGDVTKDQYANTLREYQKSQDEMKSDARDKALALRRMGG